MNLEEKAYLDLMSKIFNEGSIKTDRTGVGTKSIFGTQLRFSLENNKIPLLTTKKMHLRGIIEELLFFIRGETDTKKLEAKGVNIWKGNTTREFLDKRGLTYLPEGDMGKGYGFQWRSFGKSDRRIVKGNNQYGGFDFEYDSGTDQLAQLIDGLKKDPHGRRHIISAWNPNQLDEMVLPPCHVLLQLYVDGDNKLSSQFYMRSVDSPLGLPYNLASYAIFTKIIAKAVNLDVKELVFSGGDTHIYSNHTDQVKEQIGRVSHPFPELYIDKEISNIKDMENLSFEDFRLENYKYEPAIKAPMAI